MTMLYMASASGKIAKLSHNNKKVSPTDLNCQYNLWFRIELKSFEGGTNRHTHTHQVSVQLTPQSKDEAEGKKQINNEYHKQKKNYFIVYVVFLQCVMM